MVAAAAPTVWAVTGATRGMGLEFCTQVGSSMQKFRPLQSRDIPEPALFLLQILSLHNTKVIAGARPGENADDLQALSEKYEGRVMIVQMELLDKESVKVGHCKPAPGKTPILTAELQLFALQAAIQRVQEAHVGGVDYLINNAGVLGQYSRAQDQ